MGKRKVFFGIAAFVLAMALSFIVSLALGAHVGILVIGISSVVMLIPACFFIKMQDESPIERFAFRLPSIKHFFAAVLVFVGANSVSSGIMYALYSVYYKNASSPDTQTFDYLTRVASPGLILLCIAVIPAIVEEMLFRGYIQTAFTDGKRRAVLGITASSLLFCIAHGSIYKAPATLIMGIAFGYIAYKSESILITAILHFVNNANSIISYYSLKNSSEEAIGLILKESSNYFLAAFGLAFGVLLVFIGTRLFAEKKMGLMRKVIVILVSSLICAGSLFGILLNEKEKVYQKFCNEPVSDGQIVEEALVLDKNTLCMINGVFSLSSGVDYEFTLYNDEGKVVCDDISEGAMLFLDEGEYTVKIEFSVEEGTEYTNAAYRVVILSFGEYSRTGS